jgi:hypothetical protein
MTLIDPHDTRTPAAQASATLYRDIHKGIRAELFALTSAAGNIDPSYRRARAELAVHVGRVVDLLESHAGHEDAVIDPVLAEFRPDLSEKICTDHARIDARMVALRTQADEAADGADGGHREAMYSLYLELASFTGAYLEHQDVEERVVMPALLAAVGEQACAVLHGRIVGSIPPQQMASSLAIMLPAMNIDDRAEMLGGIRGGAPADVFQGVWGLVGSVLTVRDREALAARLGLADA